MRRIIKWLKNIFGNKKEDNTLKNIEFVKIEIVPAKRDVNLIKLVPSLESAQTLYNYIYNKYVFHMSKYEKEAAETYKDLLVEIKQIAEKNWYVIMC